MALTVANHWPSDPAWDKSSWPTRLEFHMPSLVDEDLLSSQVAILPGKIKYRICI